MLLAQTKINDDNSVRNIPFVWEYTNVIFGWYLYSIRREEVTYSRQYNHRITTQWNVTFKTV